MLIKKYVIYLLTHIRRIQFIISLLRRRLGVKFKIEIKKISGTRLKISICVICFYSYNIKDCKPE